MRNADSAFVNACLGREVDHTPVWFMRQAGRFLPSYRRIKGERNIIDLAKNPALASEVVVDSVQNLGVDAGIIFADIMLPLEPMGVKFRIEEEVGPIVANPVMEPADISNLRKPEPENDLPFVYEGIDETIRKLDGRTPLIGFSGAPFTLAAYMIEGGPSRELTKTKVMMYSSPELWSQLMRRLTDMVKAYLAAQVRHGVSAIQLFDSWVGCLSPDDYRESVLPFTKEIFQSVSSVPKIHFCADSDSLVEEFHSSGPDVLSVDWRMPIDQVWTRCAGRTAAQGNLDPAVAVAGGEEMEEKVANILARAEGKRGHIFSLGHGVLRDTDPENLRHIVKMVHSKTGKKR